MSQPPPSLSQQRRGTPEADRVAAASSPSARAQGREPVSPEASEATRLLCVGVHHDRSFRGAVLDELYVHEERFPAPSVGIDAGRVLSHAAQARRRELGWTGGILAVWLFGAVAVLTGFGDTASAAWFSPLLLIGLLLVVAERIGERPSRPSAFRRVMAPLLRWAAYLGLLALVVVVITLMRFPELQAGLGMSLGQAQVFLFVLVALTALLILQREQHARSIGDELSSRRFPATANDPAERSASASLKRFRDRLRAEQHQPIVMYEAAWPFLGYGSPFEEWTLAVELRPQSDREPVALDNEEVLRRITPLVEALRVPAPQEHRGAETVLDRLRELVVDQCVFLPVDRLEQHDGAPYRDFEAHRSAALEEGGEARRHFLRIRVGGWNEELVITVFVRVHTQGGMLMLEFAPHVLNPVRRTFLLAERETHRLRKRLWLERIVKAFFHTPATLWEAAGVVRWWLADSINRMLDSNSRVPAEGPRTAVRELGADDSRSLFQDMDVRRYLKTIQERVVGGVHLALHEAGWETQEFEQKTVNVIGGVYIGTAQGSAIGIGDQNTVTQSPAGQA